MWDATSKFNGWIDEFIVMNKILTQADVDMLYASKYDISAINTQDFSLEAKWQKNSVSTMEKTINIGGQMVAKDSSNLYRLGYTPGQGFASPDKMKVVAKY